MTEQQKIQIIQAWIECDEEDRSTEYLLQYCSDVSGVEYSKVVDYLTSKKAEKDRAKYKKSLI